MSKNQDTYPIKFNQEQIIQQLSIFNAHHKLIATMLWMSLFLSVSCSWICGKCLPKRLFQAHMCSFLQDPIIKCAILDEDLLLCTSIFH